MLSFYQQVYPFKPVFFTTSPLLIDLCDHHQLSVITSFSANPFGVPYLVGMLEIIREKYGSVNYGYMNADILMAADVFEGLEVIAKKVEEGVLSPIVGIVNVNNG